MKTSQISSEDSNDNSSYKWILLAFLWCAFFLHQGTRQLYNAIIPQIQNYMGVDSFDMGMVGTVFTMTYGICAPLSGFASDFLKRKYMVVCGLAIFCSGIFLSGTVSTIGAMLVCYGLLNGAGQAFYYPAACSLLGQMHEKTRATALSIHQTALYFGIVLCSYTAGWLGELKPVGGVEGWRLPFLIFGAAGIVLAIILSFAMRDTKPRANSADDKASFKDAFFVMLKKPSAMMLAFAFASYIYVDCGFKTWMPTLMQERFAMDAADAALNAVLWHYLGALVGIALGSRWSDRNAKRRPKARFETNIAGLWGGIIFVWLMANTGTQAMCFLSLFFFGIFRGIYDSNLFAALFDVVAPRYRASASGIMLGIAFVFGSTAPAVLGYIRDHFTLVAGMSSLAIFYFIAGALILVARNFFFDKDCEKL